MGILDFLINISWVAVFCFIAGLVLVVTEMHMPGFGVPGISGGVLLLLGTIFSARSFDEALILIIIMLAILGMALTIVLQSAAKGRLSRSLILNEELDKESGYIGTEDLEYYLDKEGTTVTALRPSGTADIDGVRLDVLTEGEYIQKECSVKVIKVEGRRIVVKKV